MIDLTASGTASESGTSYFINESALTITSQNGDEGNRGVLASYCIGIYEGTACSGLNNSFSVTNQPINIYANEIYTVALSAEAVDFDYGNAGAGPFSVSTTVDPFLSLDPASAAAYPDAQLVLSPGVQQQAGAVTPEPSTGSLTGVCIGFLVVIAAYKRQRKPAV